MGEFGLIKHLTKDTENKNESTFKGVGDDCAVICPETGMQTLVTTDMLMEGVHFDLTYMPLRHLGYKAVMVNLSDIYAMNGTPRQITVSLAISKRFMVEDIEELYSGMKLACQQHGVDIVGGDTTSSMTGLAISITAIGTAKKEDIAYRNGAKETDLICVSGNLGAAYMGLQLLEREKSVFMGESDAQPDFSALADPEAQEVIRMIEQFPEIAKNALNRSEPSMITRFSVDLAQAYNKFYYERKVMVDDEGTKKARLMLTEATRDLLAKALNLIGVSAPERM